MGTEYVYLTEAVDMYRDDGTRVVMQSGRYELVNYLAGTCVTVDTRIEGIGHQMLPSHLFNRRFGGLVITKSKKEVENE